MNLNINMKSQVLVTNFAFNLHYKVAWPLGLFSLISGGLLMLLSSNNLISCHGSQMDVQIPKSSVESTCLLNSGERFLYVSLFVSSDSYEEYMSRDIKFYDFHSVPGLFAFISFLHTITMTLWKWVENGKVKTLVNIFISHTEKSVV